MIEVVCAVIEREGRILVCQRAEGAHLAGRWEFPGGKVEDGEGPEEALRREIREELGCEVVVGEGLEPVKHTYPEVAIRLWPYLCRVAAGEPRALEHAALAWVERGELAAQDLASADVAVARVVVG